MRLTIVQYAGDYREAWERFERGGKATYQAQRYSVGFVGSLAQRLEQVAVVCLISDEPYDVTLGNGVRAIGGGFRPGFNVRDAVPMLARTGPDRLVITTPQRPLLHWAAKQRVATITALADSFRRGGPLTTLRQRLLARELNRRNIEWVGNHGIAACLSLRDIGVRADRIIPWDWPPSHRPSEHEARSRSGSGPLKLAYVGSIAEAKGVGDLLRALARLGDGGATLTLVGNDPDGNMKLLARELNLGARVHFAGLVANEDVPAAMRQADAVVIPSRHEYPEGLPLTIYEALAARTPIIASDHPMFRGALVHEQSALVFPASDSDALASAIDHLSNNPTLYHRLSANSLEAWEALQLPVAWGTLIEKWLSTDPADKAWLRGHRLTSGLYDRQIAVRRAC